MVHFKYSDITAPYNQIMRNKKPTYCLSSKEEYQQASRTAARLRGTNLLTSHDQISSTFLEQGMLEIHKSFLFKN